ncbi:T9SS type A sorting domain-containing protein [Hymenobacter latericus]|uniref:T9SS type A sorting domain-containing protein n=1 Tax=Hymenobacter sp. YIM 151858-1 TaxID=2987688 RepID=UPI0022268726|nr:T9SS type A sorting domain-containing protein [Hymenobacter sp. YIM 151858-1]UYZ58015.1 T9SS type A sorting domain-containing protein [Hymenobacter sp. YIM 151858-1]
MTTHLPTRRLWLPLLGLWFPLALQAQTVVFSEDFEGADFGSFTAANAAANKWFAGSVPGNGPTTAGSKAAFVAKDNGTTHEYDLGTTSVSHLYRTVALPAGHNVFELSFDWKNQGDVAPNDVLRVYLAPEDFTPTAGAQPSASANAVLVTTAPLSQQNSYARLTLPLPGGAALAGTTRRLVFTWGNNASSGSQMPAAIDNVVLTASTVQPLPAGTYTIDNTRPGSATNFASLRAAFERLNQAGAAGAVAFEVAAGQTFGEALPPLQASGTATARIVFRRAGAGANPVVQLSTGAAAIDLAGADYVTFDGIDVQAGPGNGPLYGYRVRNASPTDGAQGNIIRNASITLNRAINSVELLQGTGAAYGAGAPTAGTGVSIGNYYHDLKISNANSGVWLLGAETAYPDMDNEVARVQVGNGTPGDIGNATLSYGMQLENQYHLSVHDNLIRGVHSSNAAVYGIQALGLQGTDAAASRLYNNRISDVRFASATSPSTLISANGLAVAPHTVGPQTIYLYNNVISGVVRDFNATTTPANRLLRGIHLTTTGTNADTKIALWHNTVQVNAGTDAKFISAAFESSGSAATGGKVDIRNNIFANLTGAQTAGKHYVLYFLTATAGSAGSVIDYNNLYLANSTGGFVGRTTAFEHAALPEWRTATSQDAKSLAEDPKFVSATDLRPTNGLLKSKGVALPEVTADVAGTLRPSTSPDLGAYEFTVLSGQAPRTAELGVAAYPVPFGNRLQLRLAQPLRSVATVELLDALGKRVCTTTLAPAAQTAMLENLGALKPGTYVLRLVTADGRQQALRVLR